MNIARMRIAVYCCLVLAWQGLILLPVLAQSPLPFSQSQQRWQQVASEHIVVYHQPSHRAGAARVARYAELARYELGLILDFPPEQPATLVYVPQEEAALFAPLRFGQDEPQPGIFGLPRGYRLVVHPEETQQLYGEVRRQMAYSLLQEFSYGDNFNQILQKQILFYDARWFTEGLADFLGHGWTYADERRLATLTSYELLQLALEGDGPIHRSARKSIWYYITNEYGEQKISEIVYLVNISNNIESGVISVLGVTLKTLTSRWQEYMSARFHTQTQRRARLSEVGNAIRLPHQSGEPTSFAFHRASGQIAVFFANQGQQQLWLYDLEQRRYQSTPLRTGLKRADAHNLTPEPPLAWSHDGKWLATTAYLKGRYQLAFYHLPTQEITYVALPSEVEAIRSLSWAYHDDRLAYAVQHEGRTDIWLGRPRGSDFVPLTDDAWDDLDPVWSLDDQFLFFASNRDSLTLRSRQPHWQSYQQHFDIFRLSLPQEGERELVRITETPNADERNPFPVSSYQVVYQSNASGIANLEQVNVFTHAIEPLTNFAVGISAVQGDEQRLLLRQPLSGASELFWVPMSSVTSRRAPEPTLLRLADDNAYREGQRQALAQARRDSMAQAELLTPPPRDTVAEALPSVPEQPAPEPDPAPEPAEEADEPVRYYIFDEESDPYDAGESDQKPERQPSRPNRPRPVNSEVLTTVFGRQPAPKLADIELTRSNQASSPWQTDFVGLNLQFDPFAKLGLAFTAGFSDVFNQHSLSLRVVPFFNFENFMGEVHYTYRKGYIDWFAELGVMRRQRDPSPLSGADPAPYRFNQFRLIGGGRYPLSAFAFIEGRIGGYQINRLDQRQDLAVRQDAADQVAQAGASIHYQRLRSSDGFRQQGVEAQAGFDSYYSVAQQTFAFHRVQFDGRYYRPLTEKLVLALRLSGAFNLPLQMEQYYLGGVDQRALAPIYFEDGSRSNPVDPVMDTSLYQAHFLGFATPVRGFRNAVRSGSRFLLGNVELRIPVSRLLKSSLTATHLYNLEIIPFFDMGAVWVEGNPFSQKKPTDTRLIPMGTQGPFSIELQTLKSPFLVGFGSGVRLNVVGWSIRADLAWSVDDYTVQSPSLTFSMGKNF